MAAALTEQILCFGETEARPSRRHDYLRQRQSLPALLQKPVGRIAVIGAIAKETADPAAGLIQKIGQNRDAADILIGQVRGDDAAVVGIDAKMELT